MVSKQFAKANNRMCPDYDNTKPNVRTPYIDANSLYSWTMMQVLLVGGFQSCTKTLKEILATPDDVPEDLLFEVDLVYPA